MTQKAKPPKGTPVTPGVATPGRKEPRVFAARDVVTTATAPPIVTLMLVRNPGLHDAGAPEDGGPLAGIDYTVAETGQAPPPEATVFTSDADGTVAFQPQDKYALQILRTEWDVHYTPIPTEHALETRDERLRNLGYERNACDPINLMCFQYNNGLFPDGVPNAATDDQLVKLYEDLKTKYGKKHG